MTRTRRPRGPPLRRAGAPIGRFIGLAEEKTFFVHAPGEIVSDKLIVYRVDFLLRRGARDLERTALPRGAIY